MANQHAVENYQSVGTFYHKQHRLTPVAQLFFAPTNIAYLKDQLEQILQRLTYNPALPDDQQVRIEVPVTDEFAQTMDDVASRNLWLANSGQDGLRQLNEMFLQWEARIQYASLRHRKLFYKYFIDGDRMRVFPYGAPTKVTRGEVKIAPSGYMLSNPYHKQYGNFLQDVLCDGQKPGRSDVNCTRPYPQNVRT